MYNSDFDLKMKRSIERLKTFEPEDGYFLAFSGGKDSQCIYHLAEMAGVKFEAVYHVTSVDPPELVRFIKQKYTDVRINIPKDKNGKPITMWNLIVKNGMPPTRLARYCCKHLKESGGKGKVTITGVRWAESVNRKNTHGVVDIHSKSSKIISQGLEIDGASLNSRGKLILNDDNDESRRMVEQCFRTRTTLVNPIVDWTDEDVWYFLNDVVKVEHCSLYDNGYTRIGCIGCPLNYDRKKELEKYPKYKDNYLRAFERMLEVRSEKGLEAKGEWVDGDSVMKWWLP